VTPGRYQAGLPPDKWDFGSTPSVSLPGTSGAGYAPLLRDEDDLLDAIAQVTGTQG
jgi:hypothetical protein